MTFLEISLILIVLILSYTTWNLLRKNEKQEDILAEYLNYLDNLSKIIEHSANRLQKIDDKGTFKSDDEIGWFFEEILAIQSRLNNFRIVKVQNGDAEEEKTKK